MYFQNCLKKNSGILFFIFSSLQQIRNSQLSSLDHNDNKLVNIYTVIGITQTHYVIIDNFKTPNSEYENGPS